MIDLTEYLTTKETAEILAIRFGSFARNTIIKKIQQGKIQGVLAIDSANGLYAVPLSYALTYEKQGGYSTTETEAKARARVKEIIADRKNYIM